MQIISCRANEGIVIDDTVVVTVLEIGASEVTLELAGPDGRTEIVTLSCTPADALDFPVQPGRQQPALARC